MGKRRQCGRNYREGLSEDNGPREKSPELSFRRIDSSSMNHIDIL